MPYRSYVAKYAKTNGTMLLGGVNQSQSSRWSHRADAEDFLACAMFNNGGEEYCTGNVVETNKPAEILRHCGKIAQAIGGKCFHCGKVLTAADAKEASKVR